MNKYLLTDRVIRDSRSLLAVSSLLVGGLFSSCESDIEADITSVVPSSVDTEEALLLEEINPDGIRPSVSLISPASSSIVNAPIVFEIENVNGAPEEVALAEYYFT